MPCWLTAFLAVTATEGGEGYAWDLGSVLIRRAPHRVNHRPPEFGGFFCAHLAGPGFR
jgi:hypothetical protein